MHKLTIILIMLSLVLCACQNEELMPEWEELIAENIITFDLGDIMSITKYGDDIYASGRDGVYVIRDNIAEVAFEDYNMNYVRAVLGVDMLYIATDTGLYTYDGFEIRHMTIDNSILPHNRINALFEDSSGDIWVGSWGGVTVFGSNPRTYTSEDGLWVDNVSVISQSEDGTMWFGSYAVRNGGITFGTPGRWKYFTLEDGLSHENITSILCKGKTTYIGTGLLYRGGLDIMKFDENKWQYYDTIIYERGLLAGEKVRSLYQDNQMLWIGSEYDGMAVLDLDKMNSVIIKLSLPHPEIKAIFPDGDDLFIGTLDGLGKLSKNEVAYIYQQLR